MRGFYDNTLAAIPNTLSIISKCWDLAEQELQENIERLHPGSGEEFITQLFHGKFGAMLQAASRERLIEHNFLLDLRAAFPNLIGNDVLSQVAHNIVADLTLHSRNTEARTGGDFGLVIIRPMVAYSGRKLSIGDYKTGLLCQAKLKNEKGKWGKFTKTQLSTLPDRLQYLSLLLYSFSDVGRRKLNPFQWKVCRDKSMQSLQLSLKQDQLGDVYPSHIILEALGDGNIGTDDKDIIENIISPVGNPTITIVIWWPYGHYPGSEISIEVTSEQTIPQQVLLYG